MKRRLFKKFNRLLIRVFHDKEIPRYFMWIIVSIILLVFISAVLFQILERYGESPVNSIRSFMDAIWWAIVTITTVGYGDVVPTTFPGRILGIALIFVGFTLFSLLTGLIASLMVEDKLKGARGVKPIKERGHIMVCGWNETAAAMLSAFSERNIDDTIVLIGEFKPEFFSEQEAKYPNLVLKFVRGDYSQKEILERANIAKAQHVIVIADENLPRQTADDRSVIAANAIRFCAPSVPLTIQLLNAMNKGHLDTARVDNIVSFDEMGGYMLASNIISKHTLNLYNNLLHHPEKKCQALHIPQQFVGRKYHEVVLHFYEERGVILIGILNERPQLDIEDIFSADSSPIDAFIKQALEQSQSKIPDQRFTIHINPEKSYLIQERDQALVID